MRIALALAVALVGTNGWWLSGVAMSSGDKIATLKYQQMEEHNLRKTAQAALLAMPVLAAELPQAEVVERVARAVAGSEPFEKDGVTVVGSLSLKFDEDTGRLVKARSIFSPDIVFMSDAWE